MENIIGVGLVLALLFFIVGFLYVVTRDQGKVDDAKGKWVEPEDLGPEQDAIDKRLERSRFWVYVLATSYGHYVGHSARPRARYREHVDGRVPSTAGARIGKTWVSQRFPTRRDAQQFEAALKSLRDARSSRFKAITGYDPAPWKR